MKNCLALSIVVAAMALAHAAQGQQSMLGQQMARPRGTAGPRAQAAAMNQRAMGTHAPPFSSMMFGRTINSQLPYNPAGSEYKMPTGHPTAFSNVSTFYGGAQSIGIYYPAAGQSQRRR